MRSFEPRRHASTFDCNSLRHLHDISLATPSVNTQRLDPYGIALEM